MASVLVLGLSGCGADGTITNESQRNLLNEAPSVADIKSKTTAEVSDSGTVTLKAFDYDDNGASYRWSLGDTQYAEGKEVSVENLPAGTYTFLLTITYPNGTVDTVEKVVVVGGISSAMAEVIEDIAGNANATPVTATQLNSIEGVSGAVDGRDYTTELKIASFVDKTTPTAPEIQAVVDSVNTPVIDLMAEVKEDIAGNANATPVTATQLNIIDGVSGAVDGRDYTDGFQAGIYVDSSNPTPAEIQTVIDSVNAKYDAMAEVVEDIGGNGNGVKVTSTQLNSIDGVTGAIDGTDYTSALQNGTFADSSNPTPSEIQAVIDNVNSVPTLIITNDITNTTEATLVDGSWVVNATYTFTFSEDVTGFIIDDINLSNGTKKVFSTVSPSVYTLTVTLPANPNGDIVVTLPSGAVEDSVANPNAETSSNTALSVIIQKAFITTWYIANNDDNVTIPSGGTDYEINWGDGNSETRVSTDMTHIYAVAGDYNISITGDFTHFKTANATQAPTLLKVIQWGMIKWTSMNASFKGATNLEINSTDLPDLSMVTDMNETFSGATNFNSDISGWDVSHVTDMNGTFNGTTDFNGSITTWDVSHVTIMSHLFDGARAFNQDISTWNTSSATTMAYMFHNAVAFNAPIGSWNVSSVTDMQSMFAGIYGYGPTMFNQPLASWDVSKVTTIKNMFYANMPFNQPLNSWNVSAVIDMSGMFFGYQGWGSPYDSHFDQPLDTWDTSSVVTMTRMFQHSYYQQDLSGWDVSAVTDSATDISYFNAHSTPALPLAFWPVF